MKFIFAFFVLFSLLLSGCVSNAQKAVLQDPVTEITESISIKPSSFNKSLFFHDEKLSKTDQLISSRYEIEVYPDQGSLIQKAKFNQDGMSYTLFFKYTSDNNDYEFLNVETDNPLLKRHLIKEGVEDLLQGFKVDSFFYQTNLFTGKVFVIDSLDQFQTTLASNLNPNLKTIDTNVKESSKTYKVLGLSKYKRFDVIVFELSSKSVVDVTNGEDHWEWLIEASGFLYVDIVSGLPVLNEVYANSYFDGEFQSTDSSYSRYIKDLN
jgi:hypothetical protein